jgi:hypothetical protein
LTIDFIPIQESDGCWSAQCLQYDIATQADTYDELRPALDYVLRAHVVLSKELGFDTLSRIGPAPAKFWRMSKEQISFVAE